MKSVTHTLLLIVPLVFTVSASARDLGKIGPTFDIAETHLLELIKERLQEKLDSGFVRKQSAQRVSRYLRRLSTKTNRSVPH